MQLIVESLTRRKHSIGILSTLMVFLTCSTPCEGSVSIRFTETLAYNVTIFNDYDSLALFGDSIEAVLIDNVSRKDLDEKIIPRITNIQELHYSDSSVLILSHKLYQLVYLQSLILRTPQLLRLSDSIASFQVLKYLVILESQVSVIPAGVYRLLKMKVLYFNNSRIDAISNEISNLKNLVFLSLSGNCIQRIDLNTISNLNQLIEIRLDGNCLTNIPEDICKLSSLMYAWLQDNCLTSVPACMYEMPSLTRLQLYQNPLSHLEYESYEQYLIRIRNIQR